MTHSLFTIDENGELGLATLSDDDLRREYNAMARRQVAYQEALTAAWALIDNPPPKWWYDVVNAKRLYEAALTARIKATGEVDSETE